MERKQQPSHNIKDGAGFNQDWLFTNNKWEGDVKVGHKAKPIKPFLRQNKKGVFQYATVERESNELTSLGCTNTVWLQAYAACPAHGEQQAPHLGALSKPRRKASLFDYVTRPDLYWIRHLELDSVNVHTPPSPPHPLNMHMHHLPGSVLAFFKLYWGKNTFFECQISEKGVNKSTVWLCLHPGCGELSSSGGSRGLLPE